MKRRIVFILFCISAMPLLLRAQADSSNWQWAVRMGGTYGDPQSSAADDQVTDMAVDSRGNVFVCGYTMTPVVAGDSLYRKFRKMDGFLVSYDCRGNFRWLQLFGSKGRDDKQSNWVNLTVDESGNVFLTGVLTNSESSWIKIGDTTFYGNNYSLHISKFSNEGAHLWTKLGKYDDSDFPLFQQNIGMKISSYKSDLVLLFWTQRINCQTLEILDSYELFPGDTVNTGYYLGWFDTGRGETKRLVQITDAWHFEFTVAGMEVDASGNVLLGLNITDTVTIAGVDFRPAPTIYTIMKFDPEGALLWHFDMYASPDTVFTRPTWIYGLATGKDDAVYFGGYTSYGEVFGPDTVGDVALSWQEAGLAFIAKINSDGSYAWLRYPDSALVNGFYGVAADKKGNIAGLGANGGRVKYGDIELDVAEGSGYWEPFYVRYAEDGSVTDAQVLYGPGGNYDEATVAGFDGAGNLYLSGYFNKQLLIGEDTLRNEGGLSDVFIAKYGNDQCRGAPLGIRAPRARAQESRLQIRPNPSRGRVTVTLLQPEGNVSERPLLSLYDLSGCLLRSGIAPQLQLEGSRGMRVYAYSLDTEGLPAGPYIVRAGHASARLLLLR